MRYSKLGNTGLEVSVIGFGASPLGNAFEDVTAETAVNAVSTAIEHGINLFDVSPYYGLTVAEKKLGRALGSRRKDVLIATKCGRYGANEFDFSAKTITKKFEQSLGRLRTDHADLLQAHDIEFGDLRQIIEETIPAMQLLKQQGKVRFIGLTGYWPGFLARVAEQAEIDCLLNYCHSNLFVNDMDRELVPVVERLGIGLLNASPLHMGLLAHKPVPAWHPAPENVRRAAHEVRLACERFGIDSGTLALRVCLDHRFVASTLIGISNVSEVKAACAALDEEIPQELFAVIQEIMKPAHNVVWPSGLKENQDAIAKW